MNDVATIVGVDDQKTLMEENPNKIKNLGGGDYCRSEFEARAN
jgi:hypothetical protein